jgi:hypothetical protein
MGLPVAAAVLAILVHRGALDSFFAQDDIAYLSRAAGLTSFVSFLRPLSAGLAFRIQHALFGLDPRGYFVINMALHALNVAGVYALALRIDGRRSTAIAAAILFGCSAIAFTPLHWASGIIELLTASLVFAATLLYLEAEPRGHAWRWGGAALAFAAMLSKETAVAWVLAICVIEGTRAREGVWRRMAPAVTASVVWSVLFMIFGPTPPRDPSDTYALTASPVFFAQNLLTYVAWYAAPWDPIPDRIAAIDPGAWRIALPVLAAFAIALWRGRDPSRRSLAVGLAWWVAFLLPVLPLAHRSYFYYLYLPWIGGSIAVASIGQMLLERASRSTRRDIGLAALAGFVALEVNAMHIRSTATQDALPIDRTLRDATVLRHAIPTLQSAALPPGTRVGFVNPAPRRSFDLMTGAPTRAEDARQRSSYYPLEAAMRGGETLKLFVPGVEYAGFERTIPVGAESTEWFYFEQRGWLERWGHGRAALTRQGEVQRDGGQSAAAESTFARARAITDSLPAASPP